MARPPRSGLRRAVTSGRRAWPILLAAYERWQSLSEEDKERYRRQARGYADRGRRVVADARARRGRGGPGR